MWIRIVHKITRSRIAEDRFGGRGKENKGGRKIKSSWIRTKGTGNEFKCQRNGVRRKNSCRGRKDIRGKITSWRMEKERARSAGREIKISRRSNQVEIARTRQSKETWSRKEDEGYRRSNSNEVSWREEEIGKWKTRIWDNESCGRKIKERRCWKD